MLIQRFTVDICKGCLDLDGEMCSTSECALCFSSTMEIEEFLSKALIKVQGEMVQTPIWEYDSEDFSDD